jgi:hypothetical protein
MNHSLEYVLKGMTYFQTVGYRTDEKCQDV